VMGIASLHPSYALVGKNPKPTICTEFPDHLGITENPVGREGPTTNRFSYCSDDSWTIWRPPFIALRLLT
jgi:hypothetical protein